MKTSMLYLAAFLLFAAAYFALLSTQPSPQSRILGDWKEVSWEYEKADNPDDGGFDFRITDHIKSQIAENLIIHQAEIWSFGADESLHMSGKNNSKSSRWKLKGRGNVLKISGAEDQTEHYKIQELTPSRMVLHFNSDMQVRGIVKMTFEKIRPPHHDQEIQR
ncbi:lipocalin family protein [Algoriphagus sp. H41]|uniref:Lipocalin family protein n=1 Tax=Algoriphagus oliviformis TaxID=2811231 RepID=A0ABS3C3I8_9BACT|nr:lipocalin family protein [Algoriphagus oliviformis]MBN7810706.1 lipocalin family protein [Algoriphagus oliviformis]